METYTYHVTLERKGEKYWASSEAFPGVFGLGDSVEEAKANIVAAMKLCIEECIAENRPIPRADACQNETVSIAV